MVIRLNLESKRALLEQAIRVKTNSGEHTDVFVKLLLVNRGFIGVGRYFKITQLCVNKDWQNSVRFYFGVNLRTRTRYYNFNVKKACQLVELFEIKLLKIETYCFRKDHLKEYWPLINCVEGKFDLTLGGVREDEEKHPDDSSRDLIAAFWDKITSLRAPARLFGSWWCQTRKHFDRLSVDSVSSIGELKRILSYDVDRLQFEFDEHYLSERDVDQFIVTAEKVNIKTCDFLHRNGSGDMNIVRRLIRCITEVSPTCCEIQVRFLVFGSPNWVTDTTDELVVKIVETYDILVKAKASIGAFPFNIHLIVSGLCRTSLPYESQNAEAEWFNLLKQNNPVFLNAVYRINDATRPFPDGLKLESVDGMLKSTLSIEVEYNAVEYGQFDSEMDSDVEMESDMNMESDTDTE